ncbi:hypothetical protein KY359_03345 [Candidatus Woesearchaeota archaeon]|nr:hypothetical protein [Candidatus Woesearchaeota archaeon]
MKEARPKPFDMARIEEDFREEADFDVYAEEYDDEDLIDRGMQAHEVAFLRGFKRYN